MELAAQLRCPGAALPSSSPSLIKAKEAADTDTDRRRVWADDDGTSSRVQKIRLPIGKPQKTDRGGPSPAVSPAVSPASRKKEGEASDNEIQAR